MPSGIILSSGSIGSTEESIKAILEKNGYEADKPAIEEPKEPVEPKREDFASDEEFETAQEQFEEAQEQSAEEKAAKEPPKAEPSKKSRMQRKIEAATKSLQDELRKANERLAALEGKNKPAAEPELKAPKRDDFKTDQEYDDALFDYRYQLRRQKEAVEEQQKAAQSRLQENFDGYKSAVAAFKEEHDDWNEVVGQAIQLPESVFFAIVDLAEEGPAVSYYLGKNPGEVQKYAEMTPYRAAIEIGRLADRLKGGKPAASAASTPKPKPRALPDPVKPVSSAPGSSALTFREIAAKPNYPGKMRDLKRAAREGR